MRTVQIDALMPAVQQSRCNILIVPRHPSHSHSFFAGTSWFGSLFARALSQKLLGQSLPFPLVRVRTVDVSLLLLSHKKQQQQSLSQSKHQ